MHNRIKDHIEAIHIDDVKLVLAVSGSGTKALSWILEIPGASNTLLEAVVPYSVSAMSNLIGKIPQQSVSEETAIDMARAAYFRAVRQRSATQKTVGVSCTAALTTNRARRGQNQAYIGFYGADFLKVYRLEITKGKFNRTQEEIIISEFLVDKIALELLATHESKKLPSFVSASEITSLKYASHEEALLATHIKSIQMDVEGIKVADQKFAGGILSGSFNPVHVGHMELASAAKRILKRGIAFEISVANVDKPNLTENVIEARASQFIGKSKLLFTLAPLFSEKAVLYPESTFVIGWDTAVRLVDQNYYGGSAQGMYKSLEQIERNRCGFLVAGRQSEGQFMSLSDVRVPERFQTLFTEIPESIFRMDIASTDIRTA